MIDPIFSKLKRKEDLFPQEVREVFSEILTGSLSEKETADFLLSLKEKGEKPQEIAEAIRVVREQAILLRTPFSNLVDNCGTGGDESSTFNISTAAALIAAAAGAKVAKHGNRAFSSQTGSADVLEALGIRIDISPEKTIRCLEETGFGFLFAPFYHPALKRVAEVRKKLKTRTIFNLIGPLANPAGVKRQLIGVSNFNLLSTFGEVLQELKLEQAMVVHGKDGLDEITLTGPTEIYELKNGKLSYSTIDPKEFGFSYCQKSDLRGGNARVNAEMIESILKGEKSPRAEVAILNAAAVLYVGGVVKNLKEGIQKGREAVDLGRGMRVLEDLRKLTA